MSDRIDEPCTFGPSQLPHDAYYKPPNKEAPPAPKPKTKPKRPTTLAITDFAQGAKIVKDASAMGTMSVIASKIFGNQIPAASFQLFRDQFLADSGQPKDPLEVMLLEQQMWAHFRIADLHIQSSLASLPEHVALFAAAAAKLMAEFRRTTLALREYRSPMMARNVTVVKSQNFSAGDQQIAIVETSTAQQEKEDGSEQSNVARNLTHEEPPIFYPSIDSREVDSVESNWLHGSENSEARIGL